MTQAGRGASHTNTVVLRPDLHNLIMIHQKGFPNCCYRTKKSKTVSQRCNKKLIYLWTGNTGFQHITMGEGTVTRCLNKAAETTFLCRGSRLSLQWHRVHSSSAAVFIFNSLSDQNQKNPPSAAQAVYLNHLNKFSMVTFFFFLKI